MSKTWLKLAKDVVAKFGTVDILVNAQGLNFKHDATEFPGRCLGQVVCGEC